MKATLADIGQSRDDWRRQAEFAGSGDGGWPAALRSARAF
jgi:hypothetical protein